MNVTQEYLVVGTLSFEGISNEVILNRKTCWSMYLVYSWKLECSMEPWAPGGPSEPRPPFRTPHPPPLLPKPESLGTGS